jgi:NADH-quinone oxidoreductase subunit C
MTALLSAKEIMTQVCARFPGAAEEAGACAVLVKTEAVAEVAEYLKTADGLEFDYFNYITAVDYYGYFEVIYQATSLKFNRSVVFKTRCTRDNPIVPSVVKVWQGADFQEREIYDLFGIKFEGHPNMKRIFLWEGFDGHPLRKDFNR